MVKYSNPKQHMGMYRLGGIVQVQYSTLLHVRPIGLQLTFLNIIRLAAISSETPSSCPASTISEGNHAVTVVSTVDCRQSSG